VARPLIPDRPVEGPVTRTARPRPVTVEPARQWRTGGDPASQWPVSQWAQPAQLANPQTDGQDRPQRTAQWWQTQWPSQKTHLLRRTPIDQTDPDPVEGPVTVWLKIEGQWPRRTVDWLTDDGRYCWLLWQWPIDPDPDSWYWTDQPNPIELDIERWDRQYWTRPYCYYYWPGNCVLLLLLLLLLTIIIIIIIIGQYYCIVVIIDDPIDPDGQWQTQWPSVNDPLLAQLWPDNPMTTQTDPDWWQLTQWPNGPRTQPNGQTVEPSIDDPDEMTQWQLTDSYCIVDPDVLNWPSYWTQLLLLDNDPIVGPSWRPGQYYCWRTVVANPVEPGLLTQLLDPVIIDGLTQLVLIVMTEWPRWRLIVIIVGPS